MNRKDDDKEETAVECSDVDEEMAEKKKSNASNDNDFAFLLNIFDFMTWP